MTQLVSRNVLIERFPPVLIHLWLPRLTLQSTEIPCMHQGTPILGIALAGS